MIYLEAPLRVLPGKMNEFMEAFEKEFLPISNKLGRKLVGQWQTIIGEKEEVTNLWVYDDLAHVQRVLDTCAKSPEFAEATNLLRSLISYEATKIMVPTPLSPMK